jgi:adenine-specific DNA-methyltransferase
MGRGKHNPGSPPGRRESPSVSAPKKPTRVETVVHRDKRVNIPTDELRDFVQDDELKPANVLYPRDPSLDPQLVWRGKDELDSSDLEVPAVPIYIQEKIHPRVLIENLRQTAKAGEQEPEMTLFDDFNGIAFEELVDFYQHEQNWSNRMILGDSLLVMTSLAEKERLRGKVQTIFFDPPYGIKFGSNWQVSTRKRDVKDGKIEDATRQPEQIRAFRDTWELGVSSYLTYLRDRLFAAHDLLTDSGSVFLQIGDENVHLVRSVLDEVFGSENFVSQITFRKTSGATGDFLPGTTDFILWYGKDRTQTKYNALYREKTLGGVGASAYTYVQLGDGTRRRMTPEERADPAALPEGARSYRLDNLTSQSAGREKGEGAASWFTVTFEGRDFTPGMKARWKTNEDGMARLVAANRIGVAGNTLSYVRFIDDFPAFPLTNSWEDTVIAGFGDPKTYVVQTSTKVVERCLLMASDPGDLVLDPTCGSGTTAYCAEEWGRRWITIDTSRVALALARTRLMAARYPMYLLADSPEGQSKEAETTGRPTAEATTAGDVRKGFVLQRVPHITLKAIATNPEIAVGKGSDEIEAAIVRNADHELLSDKPYEDRKRVRVTGPFTVESLSPHRVLTNDTADHPTTQENGGTAGAFLNLILDNLGKAGVQNTVKQEHLSFDWIEPFANPWIGAHGEFSDKDGLTRRVAISIGPEYGTVGSEQVKEAAKESLKGAGFDLLLVCAFAFDAHAGETAKEFQPESSDGWAVATEERKIGRLPVLLVRMNPDLTMGEDLLKKTGAGNLFMVFGEPDLEIHATDPGVTIEIRGVDVYDPTTGQIRSSSVDDVAAWFIDTNYNGESFFVRDAYFTGAGDPFAQLKRALRADIDESAWETLYRTESRPFPLPETGRIAVKVINHYGDEVMKVYAIDGAGPTAL